MNRKPSRRLWNRYYDSKKKQPFRINYQEEIVNSICGLIDIRDKRILEVGAGRAGDSIELRKRGGKLVSLDFSLGALEIAKSISCGEKVNIELICADAMNLPFKEGCFDIVFHQGLIEHFKDPASLIMEQYRVLRKGGLLLVDVPQKYHIYTVLKHILIKLRKWPPGWETQYSIRELCELIKGFDIDIAGKYGWGSLLLWVLERYKLINVSKRRKSKSSFLKNIKGLWRRSLFAQCLCLNVGIIGKKS